jgi:hypothetical protein
MAAKSSILRINNPIVFHLLSGWNFLKRSELSGIEDAQQAMAHLFFGYVFGDGEFPD